jgi:hypothetical protein
VLANKRWLLLLMAAVALSFGVAQGAASLGASDALVHAVKPVWKQERTARRVSPRLIRHYRTVTWRWQTVMGRRRTANAPAPAGRTARSLRFWQRQARRTYIAYLHPPHRRIWLCIHRYEGSWSDAGDPYWGGLQMDRGFMAGYAPRRLLRRGWAHRWSPLEQMWVAERALRSGRGFSPWPNAARLCGVL